MYNTRKLQSTYLAALTIIALILIGSHWFVRTNISSQKDDAAVINIAGRQRMLSQRLAKYALLITKEPTNQNHREDFQRTHSLFIESHENLTKEKNSLELEHQNSEVAKKLYRKLEPSFQKILISGQDVIDLTDSSQSLIVEKQVASILKAENTFLPIMNSIVYQYEQESNEKMQDLVRLETLLLAIALAILLLEAIWIFRPMINQIQKDQEAILEKNQDLNESNQELQSITEELRQNNEELTSIQENLTTQNRELEVMSSKLKATNQDLKVQTNNLNEALINLEDRNKSVTDSIRYAFTIQKSMLPRFEDVLRFFKDGTRLNLPKDIVSGDFFWTAQTVNRHRIDPTVLNFVAVADCTGHGVPGAFMSIIGSALLTKIIKERGVTDPDQLLEVLHVGISQELQRYSQTKADGMDIAVCRFEEVDGKTELVFCGAKRPLHLWKKRENKLIEVKGTKKSIGGMQTEAQMLRTFVTHQFTLDKGDKIYLQSDGLVDQNNIERKKFGSTRMLRVLEMNSIKPIGETTKILKEEFLKFKGNEPQRDDILFVGIEV